MTSRFEVSLPFSEIGTTDYSIHIGIRLLEVSRWPTRYLIVMMDEKETETRT